MGREWNRGGVVVWSMNGYRYVVQTSAHTNKFFKFHVRSEVTFEIYEEFYGENIVRKFVQNCKAIGVGEVPNPHWDSIGTMT